jgi:hypothetical protein
VGFLSEQKSFVDFRLLVEYHDVTLAPTTPITERGGRSAAGKALQPLRKLLLTFVQTQSSVIFATGNASRLADLEMQIVRLQEDLRPCGVFSEFFTSIEKDLVWVDRLDPPMAFAKKKMPEFFLVDGEVPMQPCFSPGAPSSTLQPPPFVLVGIQATLSSCRVELLLKLFCRSEVISPAYVESTKTPRTVKMTTNQLSRAASLSFLGNW